MRQTLEAHDSVPWPYAEPATCCALPPGDYDVLGIACFARTADEPPADWGERGTGLFRARFSKRLYAVRYTHPEEFTHLLAQLVLTPLDHVLSVNVVPGDPE